MVLEEVNGMREVMVRRGARAESSLFSRDSGVSKQLKSMGWDRSNEDWWRTQCLCAAATR